jgi:hypothetical protein
MRTKKKETSVLNCIFLPNLQLQPFPLSYVNEYCCKSDLRRCYDVLLAFFSEALASLLYVW